MAVDLTAGQVKVIGNLGDEHTFRLSNPVGQELINADSTYEAENTDLDYSEIEDGVLIFPVTIRNTIIQIRRLEPSRRTLLELEVVAQ